MQKLAIIGGGNMACIFAKHAREMGLETHCFSLKKGIVDVDAFDFIHDVNILERNSVLNICQDLKIDGVVPTTELTIAVAAYVAKHMGLIGMPLSVAEVITDKYRNRTAAKVVTELHQPKYAEIASIEEIMALEFSYPIILKPTSKGGKRGVSVVHNKDQIQEAFAYAVEDASGATTFIVEEFIDGGMECSVESLSYKGKNYIIQITEKISSGAPHCVELAHHQPANLTNKMRKKVEAIMRDALDAIGLENGPCHSEIKIKDDKVYLIEFNARPGGDHITDPLIELSTGYSYIKGAIEIALDQFSGVDYNKFVNKCAGILFVTEQTPELQDIFNTCESYQWCYKKHEISKAMNSITHNDGFNNNYFIYYDVVRPDFNIKED